ncbi:hypothetical protein RIR_jg23521.t1 [Rhizophagus irregularis DAOM 181602=DAOM 197198]|nr:hypothetical protein RIR_jg23521.t1 [Rhizophagus irregularis DAOM 181602=DAOM 197198]
MIMSNLNSKLIFQNNYLNRTQLNPQDKTRHTFYNYLCVPSNLLFLIFSVYFSEHVSNFTFESFRIARASVRVVTPASQDEPPHLTTVDCTPIIIRQIYNLNETKLAGTTKYKDFNTKPKVIRKLNTKSLRGRCHFGGKSKQRNENVLRTPPESKGRQIF